MDWVEDRKKMILVMAIKYLYNNCMIHAATLIANKASHNHYLVFVV